jgi:voltage-dependent potassium channel beta subunit
LVIKWNTFPKEKISSLFPLSSDLPTFTREIPTKSSSLSPLSTKATDSIGMKYRFLGDSGLLVSAFSYGCMTFTSDDQVGEAYEILTHAYKHGVNFWDTAETYSAGISERVTGKALARGIQEGVWTREDIVISTKIFTGTKDGPNAKGLSRKHLVEGTKASLQRLAVDYVDVIFCHRPEKYTPIEEVVRSMNFIIDQGWAFYWGTSEWSESDLLEACAIADRLGLIRPIVEQPQYNLFARSKVEVEYAALYSKFKLGLTVWSPLAFGILTGKYADGIPEHTRLTQPFWAAILGGKVADRAAQVEKLRPIAAELGCTLAQLALAWCASNTNVSTVILGAKTLKQLDENLQAWPVVAKMTPEIKQKIEEIIPFVYQEPKRDAYYTYRGKFLASAL